LAKSYCHHIVIVAAIADTVDRSIDWSTWGKPSKQKLWCVLQSQI